MSETRVIRWGILSTGRIAADFATAMKHVPHSQIVAVASRTVDSARAFAAKFGIQHAYGNYEELLQDKNVEIVYIGSPHPSHFDNIMMCLKHGKHVLCEKPLTLNSKEAIQCVELARKQKLFMMEAMWTRFFPAVQKVQEIVKSGEIGDIKAVQVSFGFFNPGTVERLVDPALGAGAILDIGVYGVAFASMIFGGKAERITALGDLNPNGGFDDQVGIVLGFKHGQLAILTHAMTAEFAKECYVVGTKGRVKICEPFWCPEKINIYKKDQKEKKVLNFPLPNAGSDHYNFTNSVGLSFEISHVNAQIRAGRTESDVMSLDESLEIMRIMDKARELVGCVYPQEK